MKKWNLHSSPTQMYKIYSKTNKFKERHFISTKRDKHVWVVTYFVDLQKYKLPAAYCHHFSPQKIF